MPTQKPLAANIRSERRFESTRLCMRTLGSDDLALYTQVYTSPSLMQFVGKTLDADAAPRSFAHSLAAAHRATPGLRYWVMHEKRAKVDIGLLGLVYTHTSATQSEAEIGAMILPEWHTQGYAFEGLAALMRYAFQVEKLSVLRGMQMPQQLASIRLMTRLGFQRGPDVPGHLHSLRWVFTRGDWEANKDAPHPINV